MNSNGHMTASWYLKDFSDVISGDINDVIFK